MGFNSGFKGLTYEQRTLSTGFAVVIAVGDNRTVEFSVDFTIVPKIKMGHEHVV